MGHQDHVQLLFPLDDLPRPDSLHSMFPSSLLSLQPDLAYLAPQIEIRRVRVIMLLLELIDQFLRSGEDGIVPDREEGRVEV